MGTPLILWWRPTTPTIRHYIHQCHNDNRKQYEYVCITTNQPNTKYVPNPNPNFNPTTKQRAIVNIQLNIVACPTHREKFTRDDVGAAFLLLSNVIVTLPVAPTLWSTGGRHVPPILQMAGHGGTVSRRTANNKLTKLY